jgi:hypothetical protein
MSGPNPLAGLTSEEADQAIERLKAKVDTGIGGQAAEDHLKTMRAARKRLEEPVPVAEQGSTTVAQAEPAEITVGGSGL